jgi:hypothetical protein
MMNDGHLKMEVAELLTKLKGGYQVEMFHLGARAVVSAPHDTRTREASYAAALHLLESRSLEPSEHREFSVCYKLRKAVIG